MADNLVSQPPLTTAITDGNGVLTRAWAIWLRDVYKRIAYKGGNSIDENAENIEFNLETLAEVIDQVIINISDIEQNSDNLKAHELLEEAHGSNGNIVGFNDLATVLLVGLVNQMALVNDAVDSTVSVTSPDATISTVSVDSPSIASAPAVYDQAFTDTIVTLVNELKSDANQLVSDVNPSATLSNELKADVNQMVTDINASIAQLNELLANSKTSGQMTT